MKSRIDTSNELARPAPATQEGGKKRAPTPVEPDHLTSEQFAVLASFPEVAQMLGRKADRTSRIYLWRLQRRGAFPAALQLSANKIAWRRIAVIEWLASRPTVAYANGGR